MPLGRDQVRARSRLHAPSRAGPGLAQQIRTGLPEHKANAYIRVMKISALSSPSRSGRQRAGSPERLVHDNAKRGLERLWQVLPLSGTFEIAYEDRRGFRTSRLMEARELKLGPGRTLLGGLDLERNVYRGFRVDRIRRLSEAGSGMRIETGILDWLLDRAEAQRRAGAGAGRIRPQQAAISSVQTRIDGPASPRAERRPSV